MSSPAGLPTPRPPRVAAMYAYRTLPRSRRTTARRQALQQALADPGMAEHPARLAVVASLAGVPRSYFEDWRVTALVDAIRALEDRLVRSGITLSTRCRPSREDLVSLLFRYAEQLNRHYQYQYPSGGQHRPQGPSDD